MKFGLVDGNRIEAAKGAKGICQSCGSELIAKCGEIKINHWAHKGKLTCDPWWENETEWHRLWKGHFPIGWQEVVQFDKQGEKHIADVKTKENWVLEFQHSYLTPQELRSRNAFYPKLVWVVDGLRRKRDKSQFQKLLEEGTPINYHGSIIIHRINSKSNLLKEWVECGVPVFFDFKELEQTGLWFLLPAISNNTYLMKYSRDEFINLHNNNGFDELVSYIPGIRNFLVGKEQNSGSSMLADILRLRSRSKSYRRRF